MFLCKCSCGIEKAVLLSQLRSGKSKSCGCYRIDKRVKHGMSKTKIYRTWLNMIHRCNNPKVNYYCHYGGRGIKVCERWMKFENFYADMGEQPENTYLDRINPNDNYQPSNCRWATWDEQCNNKRNTKYIEYDNKRFSIAQFANYIDMDNKFSVYYYVRYSHLTPVQIAQKYGRRNIVNG